MDRSEEIKRLKEEIQTLTALKNEYKNEEQGIKLTMNSIYGAIGNNYFACFNPDVAEAVTLQGQDLIKYSSMLITRYFHEFWHLDTELHEKLGISTPKRVVRPVIAYGDTDSTKFDTIVHIENESGVFLSLTIEDLFNANAIPSKVINDSRGNEIILEPNIKSLNFIDDDLIYSPIKRIIRHKVSKQKWSLRTKTGKEVIVTNDHSLTIFRNGVKMHVKASEINPQTDKVLEVDLILDSKSKEFFSNFMEIESVEHIGEFENEYVYDLEISEEGYDNQTFFANNILVHNSNYVTFQEVVNSCDYKGDPKDLILKINEYRLKEYLKKSFEKYSEKWNTKNYQDFEMETLSRSGMFLGKKKYVTDLIYEDGVHIESLSRLKIIGVEMVKGGTPPFVREKLTYLTKYIFSKGSSFVLRDFVQELKAIKQDFKMQEPKNISNAVAVNNYEKFILNDTTSFEVGKACPIHVRASGYHNYILNNSKYKDKYQLIKSSQKVNFYFVKTKSARDNNVFAYPQGVFPYEFAPPLDYDEQFTKTILDPINRFIEAMGHNPISPNLFMVKVLF